MAIFKGYMRMYVKSIASSIARTEYTEDWADERKRKKIMGKARKYSITIYLFNIQGQHIVETISLPVKATQEDLGHLVFKQVNRVITENPYQVFDLVNSYINIRV